MEGVQLGAFESRSHRRAGEPRQRNSSGLQLESINQITVTREEFGDLPDGKEYYYDWQASDWAGTTVKFTTYSTRIDSYGSYTIAMHFSIRKYRSGMSLDGDPASASRHRVVVFGIKGDAVGNTRRDRVIVTVYREDGSSFQQETATEVRLGLADCFHHDFAIMATEIGDYMLAQSQI